MAEIPRVGRTEASEEQKDKKKKKRKNRTGGDFKNSWLAYLERDKSKKESAADDVEEEKDDEKSEKSKVARWIKGLGYLFSREVNIGEVSTGNTRLDSLSLLRYPSEQGESQAMAVGGDEKRVEQKEVAKEPKKSALHGELIVKHDDEAKQGNPESDYAENGADLDELPVPLDEYLQAYDKDDWHYEELMNQQIREADEQEQVNSSQATSQEAPQSMPAEDLKKEIERNKTYHKKEEQRLKNRTQKLEREGREQRTQQERLSKRQTETERRLKEQKSINPPESTGLYLNSDFGSLSSSSERVHTKAESKSTRIQENSPSSYGVEGAPEVPGFNRTSEPRERIYGQRPESNNAKDIQHRVEQAAEGNMPIEKIYERRHEAKDESSQRHASHMAGPANNNQYLQKSQSFQGNNPATPPQPMTSPQIKNNITNNSKQSDLYAKAIQSGFVSAVIILAILITIWLFM